MNKSIMTPLTAAEFSETGGKQITHMGKRRKKIVARILSSAMTNHSKFENIVKKLKNQTKDVKRDWIRVVQTEYTGAKARASLDLIRSIFGDDASVYRDPAPDCCKECKKLLSGKKFAAGKVPKDLIGALHPNCICPPWRVVQMPDLTKAMDPLADVPIGVVKRVPGKKNDYTAEISTGTGYWVPIDSATGRSIMRVILMHTPLVAIGESHGFTMYGHGYQHAKGNKFKLYDLSQMGSARFLPYDLSKIENDNERREKSMTNVCDLSSYLDRIRAALPTVCLMPNYWASGAKWRYITDFLGYKTLTDWLVIYPGEPPLESFIAEVSSKDHSAKKAIRSYVKWSINKDSLKKARTP